MLERLDSVDWSSLQHAYGEASDVPDLIRSLAAPDRDARQNAIYELYGNIWHQGTVYEATAYAVPFLIELLQQPEVPDRHEIAVLLREIGTGSSYLDVHGGFDWYRNERHTSEFQEKLHRELAWVKAAHAAVLDGIDVYLNLTKDEDGRLRAAIPFLLSVCRGRDNQIEPALHRMAREDRCEQVRASALFGLLRIRQFASAEPPQLSGRVTELAPFFRDLMSDPEESPLVRLVAAQCWVESTDSEDVSDALAAARETIRLAEEEYADLVWTAGDQPFSIFARVLSRHRSAQIDWLREGLRSEFVNDALWAIEETARESRSFAEAITPVLIESLLKATGTHRTPFAKTLACIGESAIAPLESLREGRHRELREVADETLQTIRDRRDEYRLDRILHFPGNWKRWQPARLLIAQLELYRREKQQDALWAMWPAIIELGRRGSRAGAAIPVLKKLLDHEDQWVRGLSAWSLWQIEQDPSSIWPVLMEELQCRPVGFIVLDCLSSMGPLAAEVIPVLEGYIESDRRLPSVGTTDSWNHLDDMFRAACKSTLSKIRGE